MENILPDQPHKSLQASKNFDLAISGAELRARHKGARLANLYVIMSKDGSTCLMNPGLNTPWASTNKKLAEWHCKQQGGGGVLSWTDAVEAVIKHPKNQPGNMAPPPEV